MNYSIRKLEKNDIKILSKIMKEAFFNTHWNEVWEENKCYERLNIFISISTSFSYTLINENNEICGGAIGYTVPFVNKIEYDLQEFFINPKFVKKQLGTFFMNELIKEAKKNHIDSIKFYTTDNLDKFYSKFGFNKINNEYLMERKI